METSYGALKDKWDGIRSLATLAFAKYRDPYFRNELLVALKIIQDGHIAREKFVSSWAGAMGQTQFMPTNFMDYAVDFTGDGKRDIWTNVPDVLASTANYFAKAGAAGSGACPGASRSPCRKGFDLMKSRATFAEWTKLGVRRADGKAFPGKRRRHPVLPDRRCRARPSSSRRTSTSSRTTTTPTSMRSPSATSPTGCRAAARSRRRGRSTATQLPRDDRIALQKKLAALGYDQTRFSAHIDFKMRDFVRAEQKKHGLVTDGHPTAALLDRMGVKRTQ